MASQARWSNPGEPTSIRVTKALSVATRAVEHEVPDTRKNISIAGNNFYKVQVQGELTVKNHRAHIGGVVFSTSRNVCDAGS